MQDFTRSGDSFNKLQHLSFAGSQQFLHFVSVVPQGNNLDGFRGTGGWRVDQDRSRRGGASEMAVGRAFWRGVGRGGAIG